ncbi:MAG: hypothetical protein FWD69_16465 [Polyangiaceae bacterium]|nr:hypothetical protein [Polyangiaceae bacterium]
MSRFGWQLSSSVRPYAVGAIVVAVAMGGMGFVPLFGGPGYEQSLATGLFVPSAVAIATAIDASRASARRQPIESLGRGVLAGLAFAGISLLTALLHAARVGICELWGALLYFALNPGAGSVMGGAWGSVVGELVAALDRFRFAAISSLRPALRSSKPRGCALRLRLRRSPWTPSSKLDSVHSGSGPLLGPASTSRQLESGLARRRRVVRPRARTVIALALAGPLWGIAVSVYRFFTSPMIFAFDPFVGYFSGALYDTVIDQGTAILTYRAGSLATLAALAFAFSLVERRDGVLVVLDHRSASSRARGVLAVLAALASMSLFFFGTKLGHFSTAASITDDLGAEKHGERCDVVYPKTTREREADLLVKDCDEQIAAVEQRLGAKGPPRVVAFFFRDAEDKKRLMGAANTYIAKPWRKEVYLQLGGYPHPVLGHELAHVVAGSFARGPFRIAGSAGGLLPNPGLIEGVAVFASPDDDDLTVTQWARAMMDLRLLPPLGRIFSLGFLGDASDKSYTVAGAFIGWLAQNSGTDVVRAWYAGGDLTALTGKDWSSLDRAFRASLREVTLPAEAESFARARFSRPGIFGRKCPHVVDALRREASVCRDSQRFEDAMRLYREVLAKDAADFASQKDLAVIERRHGDRTVGEAALLRLANGKDVPRVWKDRAAEALGDADFIDGDFERAAKRYEDLAARSLDEDAARTLEVKAFGASSEDGRPAVRALLLGDSVHGPDIFLGGIALGTWNATKPSALASYLMGRNLVNRGLYEDGARMLDDACARLPELPTPRLARETLRQRAIAACAMNDTSALERVRTLIASPDDPFRDAAGGRREATLRMIARCTK